MISPGLRRLLYSELFFVPPLTAMPLHNVPPCVEHSLVLGAMKMNGCALPPLRCVRGGERPLSSLVSSSFALIFPLRVRILRGGRGGGRESGREREKERERER